ncbi:hypothetical protein SOVF_211900 [Spinacia oleracea]|nr:hypothetical protein SOVF_211900 [Spinacia oleracea]
MNPQSALVIELVGAARDMVFGYQGKVLIAWDVRDKFQLFGISGICSIVSGLQ